MLVEWGAERLKTAPFVSVFCIQRNSLIYNINLFLLYNTSKLFLGTALVNFGEAQKVKFLFFKKIIIGNGTKYNNFC